jgi:hypothetical protein
MLGRDVVLEDCGHAQTGLHLLQVIIVELVVIGKL